jgi:Fe-S-cluster containining protein
MNTVTFGTTRGRRLPTVKLPECRACGACCVDDYDYGIVADLNDEDEKRLGSRRMKWLAVDASTLKAYRLPPALAGLDGRAYATGSTLRNGFIVCKALRGTVGRRCSCIVYEDRPEVCRDFKRGGPSCIEALQRAGLLPA